jgi:hypothetical protein
MLQRHLFRLSSAIVLSGLLTCVQAVELGDTLVRSHLGQPLSADIELTGIANDAATVQAGLASADVYRGASIAMHPALSSLNMTIIRRDGRRYLHIASPRAVDSEFINIFFELTENGRGSVRQATLWFTPDPNPAPPPVIVAPPPPPPAVVAKAPAAPRAIPAPLVAPLPRPVPIERPAARAPQFTAAQIATCAAIDAKNAALSGHIVELEEKVRRLTLAMQAGAVAAAPPVAVAKAAPAQRTLLKPMGAPPEKPAGKTPWLFIAIASAAILALVGVLVYVLQRKRKGAKGKQSLRVGSGLIAGVKKRLMPAKKVEPQVVAEAEPAA